MKKISYNQKGLIYKFKYQDAKNLNPKLHDKIWRHACHNNGGARMTDWFVSFKEFELIKYFAWECLKNIETEKCSYGGEPEIVSFYGKLYDRGEYELKHNNFPCHWTFIYYVNTPRFSSPIVFENKRIRAKSGDFIIFPSWMEYKIPKNWGNNMSIIIGNFYYRIR
jgi:hypothetical protein